MNKKIVGIMTLSTLMLMPNVCVNAQAKAPKYSKGNNIVLGIGQQAYLESADHVRYKTSNKKIASVHHGMITGKKKGTAKVTEYPKNGGKKIVYKIYVRKYKNLGKNDYSPYVKGRNLRRNLKVPKNAKVKITYGWQSHNQSEDYWYVSDAEIHGLGKYKGYLAHANIYVGSGETITNIYLWDKF